MWMTHNLQNVYLATDPLDVIHICDLRLVKYLYRNLLISQNVHAFFNFTKCALSKRFRYSVRSNSEAFLLLFFFDHFI